MYILRVKALGEHANVGLNLVMRRIRQLHLTHVTHVFTAISQHEHIINVSCFIYYRSFVSIISLCFFNSSASACFLTVKPIWKGPHLKAGFRSRKYRRIGTGTRQPLSYILALPRQRRAFQLQLDLAFEEILLMATRNPA